MKKIWCILALMTSAYVVDLNASFNDKSENILEHHSSDDETTEYDATQGLQALRDHDQHHDALFDKGVCRKCKLWLYNNKKAVGCCVTLSVATAMTMLGLSGFLGAWYVYCKDVVDNRVCTWLTNKHEALFGKKEEEKSE